MLAANLDDSMSQLDINTIMKNFLNFSHIDNLHFGQIETEFDWSALRAFRLTNYAKSLKYMLNELNDEGTDSYDSHSFVFAVWLKGKVIASIRLTPFPFETTQFIEPEKLDQFLGANWKDSYLEWSRLLVDTSYKINNLVTALTVYAGLTILNTTHYKGYFGFTKPLVRRILSRFQIEEENMQFSIPTRGNQAYYLLKGNFVNDYIYLKQTKLL